LASVKLWALLLLNLPSPYTQRIYVDRYWPATSLETEHINQAAMLKFTFYTHRRRQSVIFALNPAPKQKMQCKTRTQIKANGI